MPVRCARGKPRYRVKTTRNAKVRLAFCGKKVVEAKKLKNRRTYVGRKILLGVENYYRTPSKLPPKRKRRSNKRKIKRRKSEDGFFPSW